MKTAIKITFFFGLLLTLVSCDLNETLSKEIEIKDNVIEFDLTPEGTLQTVQMEKVSSVSIGEVTLLDKTFNVNVASELEDMGLSIDLIKAFAITHAKLEVTIPNDVASADELAFMDGFKNLKIYFGDKTNLVAKISGNPTVASKKGTVEITIVNGDLLSKLSEDQLHIIITGTNFPTKNTHCKFTSSYKVRAGLLK